MNGLYPLTTRYTFPTSQDLRNEGFDKRLATLERCCATYETDIKALKIAIKGLKEENRNLRKELCLYVDRSVNGSE